MIKKLLAAGAILVAVIAIGAYFFLYNLNGIIKSALEHYGSQVTQTSVDISSVDVSLTTGKGSVSGFRLGNPKSYVSAKAMTIESVDFKLNTNTVTGAQPIIIDDVNINGPDILFEVGADGHNNLQALSKNAQGYSATSAKTASKASSAPSRKVIIKNLYIRDGKVAITHSFLRGRDLSATLPTIHLTNIGESGKGATPEQVAQRILTEITKQASTVATAALQKELAPLQKIQDKLTGGKGSNPLKEMTKGFLDR